MAILGARHGTKSRGTYNVGIRLEGQWKQVNDLVNSLDILISTAAIAGQRKFALDYKAAVRRNMRSGGSKFRYPPLSPKYLKFKSKHGGSGGMFIWDKNMHDAVDIQNLGVGKVGVGIKSGLKRPNYDGESPEGNRLTISEYANVIEHGSFPMPPRPIFGDTFKSMGGKARIKETIELALINRFRSKGVQTTRI